MQMSIGGISGPIQPGYATTTLSHPKVTCAWFASAREGSLTIASQARSVNDSGFMPWLELMERRGCHPCRVLERHCTP